LKEVKPIPNEIIKKVKQERKREFRFKQRKEHSKMRAEDRSSKVMNEEIRMRNIENLKKAREAKAAKAKQILNNIIDDAVDKGHENKVLKKAKQIIKNKPIKKSIVLEGKPDLVRETSKGEMTVDELETIPLATPMEWSWNLSIKDITSNIERAYPKFVESQQYKDYAKFSETSNDNRKIKKRLRESFQQWQQISLDAENKKITTKTKRIKPFRFVDSK
jgi:hypothetical protein